MSPHQFEQTYCWNRLYLFFFLVWVGGGGVRGVLSIFVGFNLSLNASFQRTLLALREVWESEAPKNCPGTSKNQCQEVWGSAFKDI